MMRKKEVRHVRGVLDGLIQKWEPKPEQKGNAVLNAWRGAVEESVKGHARPVSMKKGVIMVIVENTTWLYRLTLEKRIILEKFNDIYEGRQKPHDIRFRVGSLDDY